MMSEQEKVMEQSGFMSAARAARLMKRTVYTIYRWIKKKEIHGMQMAGHWYVKRDSLKKKVKSDDGWKALVEAMASEDKKEAKEAAAG